FASLTPVKGWMIVRHGGNYLEITTQAETITTLTCDRCLQNYNHRLVIDTSEIIWLEEPDCSEAELAGEKEVSLADLSEKLAPNSYFEPEKWLYEQLCLATPLRCLCAEDCPGNQTLKQADNQPKIDNRWASLAALKQQFNLEE
ncbi:MAG: DUF177 domain-containing protein, partial [Cyanobacteria bacterium J083]